MRGSEAQLREELKRLMAEQIESFDKQKFVGLDQEELRQQDKRIKQIREVSADLLAVLEKRYRKLKGAGNGR